MTFTKLQTEESHHEQGRAQGRNKLYRKGGSIR